LGQDIEPLRPEAELYQSCLRQRITFKNSAAAEARRAQLQATFDRHSRVRDDD
jgi:hypothetical protein